MLAKIYINRHIMTANKKTTKNTGVLCDVPAISINTYLGVVYCKKIRFTDGCDMVQDAKDPHCSGATIWCSAKFESLIIDGVMADRSMFRY